MAVFVAMGALAAFGVMCALWAWLGCLFSSGKGGCVVCMCRPDGKELLFLRRVMLLRQLGVLKVPVYILGETMSQDVADLMKNEDFVFVVSAEALAQILELEREELD